VAEVVVALDTATAPEALALVDRLPGLRWAKLGPVLFVPEGPTLVRELKSRGVSVFLDLKWHDIPTTVAGAARAAAALGVDLASVHALGGRAMLQAAVEACGAMRLAAVTVLTSHEPAEYRETVGSSGSGGLAPEVVRLARLALGAGVHAIVTSPLEVEAVRQVSGPERWVVVPGIRPAGSAEDDQRRAAEPAAAVRAGATHLVVGRPITRADDPQAVYQSLCEAAS
jgi:orotidine-5'-phosphate decarboxylase